MGGGGQQRLCRGSSTSTSFSLATRDGLMAATAKALPLTLTYAPYGFYLISRFSFINSLRAPLAALFDPKQGRNPSALKAIQEYLAAQPPTYVPLNAADKTESINLASSSSSSSSTAAPALSPSGLLCPSPAPVARPASRPTTHPPPTLASQIDFELDVLFQALSPRNLVLVFLALLLECKVLLISERLTLLTVAGEGLRLLLHPIKWCHVYVPLVPEVMMDHVVGCPTPFLMGMHRKTYLSREADFPPDIVRVDLDNDFVQVSAKDLNRTNVPFAGPLARKFERVVSPATALSDSCRWRAGAPVSASATLQQSSSSPAPRAVLGSSSSPRSNSSGSSSSSSEPANPTNGSRGPSSSSSGRQQRDVRGALLVLRDFILGLLTGIEDSCYRIYTETEMTILFDETLFGHISGPPELLLTTPNDPDTDALPHSPHLPPAPPNDAVALEGFVLRFSRTQAFSNVLMQSVGK